MWMYIHVLSMFQMTSVYVDRNNMHTAMPDACLRNEGICTCAHLWIVSGLCKGILFDLNLQK